MPSRSNLYPGLRLLVPALAALASSHAVASVWQHNARGQSFSCTDSSSQLHTWTWQNTTNWSRSQVLGNDPCGNPNTILQPSNWSTPLAPGTGPAAPTDALIDLGPGPTVDTDIALANLTVGSSGMLDLPNHLLSVTDGAMVNQGFIRLPTGGSLRLTRSTFLNDGLIAVRTSASGGNAFLEFTTDTTLAGTGTIVMNGATADGLWAASGVTLTAAASQVIQGQGLIYASLVSNGLLSANSTGTITLSPPGPAGQITNNGTFNINIAAQMKLTSGNFNSPGTLTLGGGSLTLAGKLANISGPFGGVGTIINSGIQLTTFSGPQSWQDGTTFKQTGGGGMIFASDPGPKASLQVTGGQVTFAANARFNAFSLSSAVAQIHNSATVSVRSIALDPVASLDVGTGALVVDYPTYPGAFVYVRDAIISGRGFSDESSGVHFWDGPGISSSDAALNSLNAGFDLYGLGILENWAYAHVGDFGRAPYSTFRGLSVDSTSVLVAYTYAGGANLDGQVDGDDYTMIDQTYNGLLQDFGWMSGDFNYDGNIDVDDYALIDAGFLFQGAPIAGPSAVPEPHVALLLSAALALPRRRRRA